MFCSIRIHLSLKAQADKQIKPLDADARLSTVWFTVSLWKWTRSSRGVPGERLGQQKKSFRLQQTAGTLTQLVLFVWVGTRVQEARPDISVTARGSQNQRHVSMVIGSVNLSTKGQQDCSDHPVTFRRRLVKWGLSYIVGRVDVDLVGQ